LRGISCGEEGQNLNTTETYIDFIALQNNIHTKEPQFSEGEGGGGGDDELSCELLQLETFEMNEIRLDDRTESLRSEYVAWQPSRIASVAATDEVIRLQRNA